MKEPIAIKQYEGAKGLKLAISVCSNRPITPRCSLGLSMMVHHLTAFGVPFGLICRLQASLLPQARQECLDEALADECTHQLWWDDDIEMPSDCVLRMLQAMKEHPEIDAIAANYCRKQDTLQYTAEGLDGHMTHSAGKIGLEEVAKVGMGLMLVKLDKLRGLPSPHFEIVWNDVHRAYQGEDRYFTDKIRAAGVRIFVDHGISNNTQHWGDLGYNFRLWNREPYAQLPDALPRQRHAE
jgi:hypothetical protein